MTLEELMGEETASKMDANLKKGQRGEEARSAVQTQRGRKGRGNRPVTKGGRARPHDNGIVFLFTPLARTFTAYNCNNQSNIMNSYPLLELFAYPEFDGNRKMEIVQMKHGRINPIFLRQVLETIMSWYSSYWSAARVMTSSLKNLRPWRPGSAR